MKRGSQTFGYVVLLAGLALIFTGFFLLVPEEKRNNVFWLDLVVVCVVYFVSFARMYGLFVPVADFDKQIGGLGIRLAYIPVYSLSALAIIFICWHYKVDFRYQLYLQLIAAFFLLLIFFISQRSSTKVISVQTEQDTNRGGKEEIQKAINQFEILLTKDSAKWVAEKQKINFLKEDVRYLSPSNNQSAADLDSEIANTIQQAYTIAVDKNEGGAEVFSLLNKCEELLKLRKSTYSN